MKAKISMKIVSIVFLCISIISGVGIFLTVENTKKTIQVPIIYSHIEKGSIITKKDLIMKEVGKYNFPKNILINNDDIVGKYATQEMTKGKYIYITDVSKKDETNIIRQSKFGTVAISTDLVKVVGGEIEPNDFVEVSVLKKHNVNGVESVVLETPQILSAVRVLEIKEDTGANIEAKKQGKDSSVDGGGFDDSQNLAIKPCVILLDLTKEQRDTIVKANYEGLIHFTLLPEKQQFLQRKKMGVKQI